MDKKILGIIGGLGPMASVYFMELITRMTDAASDQEHMDILLHSHPATPDRTAYILDQTKESPVPAMAAAGLSLAKAGAGCIAIPCMTAHCFHKELTDRIPVPVIHALEEVARYLQGQGIRKAGLLATTGTIKANVFQEVLSRYGVETIAPSEEGQAGVMTLIYDQIKAGQPADLNLFKTASREVREKGAEVVILGCTELSLLKGEYPMEAGVLDVLDVLARAAVLACGYPVKPEFSELVTKGENAV